MKPRSLSPESLDTAFNLSVSNISDELKAKAMAKAKEAYVMTLLAAGEISSGKAANLLDTSRLEMIERMGHWGISLFDDSMELDDLRQEVKGAKATIEAAKKQPA